MSMHIIIDGYNLIRRSQHLGAVDRRDIQMGREALVDMLAAYKKMRPHRITVVFDGTRTPGFSMQRDLHKGIALIFSHWDETADSVIKRLARREKQKALVVSSDRDVSDSAAAAGAATIGTREFENKMAMAVQMNGHEDAGEASNGWHPSTRKKGPARRLPKKKRRSRLKIGKL